MKSNLNANKKDLMWFGHPCPIPQLDSLGESLLEIPLQKPHTEIFSYKDAMQNEYQKWLLKRLQNMSFHLICNLCDWSNFCSFIIKVLHTFSCTIAEQKGDQGL